MKFNDRKRNGDTKLNEIKIGKEFSSGCKDQGSERPEKESKDEKKMKDN